MKLHGHAKESLRQQVEKIIKLRAKSKEDRQEEEAILQTYMAALDMIDLFDPVREAAE